eukprot:COSAG04_NODE_30888_length_260_cov_0.639752_1_plen_47_part_01
MRAGGWLAAAAGLLAPPLGAPGPGAAVVETVILEAENFTSTAGAEAC